MSWRWYPKSKPRRPADGIKARTGRGKKFGQTWWASRWIAALEKLVDSRRLGRGRSYARSGQVLNLDIQPGCVESRVQGSRARPYEVRIEINPLSDEEWEKVIEAMAAQAIFAAKLLAGEMPQDIEQAFTAAGTSLFPGKRGDLVTDCSCPDWANPCKHIAAVYYLLGERFDEDPFLIFRLRGRNKDQIVAALRELRAEGEEAALGGAPAESKPTEVVVPLEACLDCFWQTGEGLDEMRFSIARPSVDAAPVKRLGEPAFWHEKQSPDFLALMSQVYAAITQAALDVAFGE